MKIAFILIAYFGHAGHEILGRFSTIETCQKAEIVADEYTATSCLPVFFEE